MKRAKIILIIYLITSIFLIGCNKTGINIAEMEVDLVEDIEATKLDTNLTMKI